MLSDCNIFRYLTGVVSGRWYSHVKDIKLLSNPNTPKNGKTANKTPTLSQPTGFLMKRRKSETRSLVSICSDNSITTNRESVISKFPWSVMKSLFYPADEWIGKQQIVKLFAASDSLIAWVRPAQDRGHLELGIDGSFGSVCLYEYGGTDAMYRQLWVYLCVYQTFVSDLWSPSLPQLISPLSSLLVLFLFSLLDSQNPLWW